MNHQPDKLFRDKLRDHQATPPRNAWARVASNLDRKRSRRPWLAIAASISLAITAAALLYPRLTETNPARIAQQHKVDTARSHEENVANNVPDSAKEKSVDPTSSLPVTGDPKPTPPRKSADPASERRFATDATPKQYDTNPSLSERNTANQPPLAVVGDSNKNQRTGAPTETLPQAEPPLTDFPVQEPAATPAPERVTIVFSAEEVNQKYLKKTEEDDATSETENASGVQRLLVIARDLRDNQGPIGELRQKKEEILAMNFRNDKKNNQAN